MAKTAYQCPSCNTVLAFEKKNDNQLVNCPKCGGRHTAGSFRQVETRKVYCPSCNTGLQIKVTSKGVLTCPKCKKTNDLDSYTGQPAKKPQPASDETDITVITGKGARLNTGQTAKGGKLVLIEGTCSPAHISLKMGLNIIGRKSNRAQPPGHIPLDTDDHCMSKKHTNIDMILRGNQMIECRLSDAGSMNGTWHNGEKLDQGDIIVLQPGDTVRIGRTVFEFVGL